MAIANEEELLSMMTAFPQARKALVIAPHPDDEIFGCGGTLALLRDSGCMVATIIVTDGALGGDNTDGKLAEIRAEESRAAARVLGLDAPVFWGLPDRGVNYGEVLIGRLIETILETDADLVFLPSPADWHPDHQAIVFAGAEAIRRLGGKRQVAFYEVSDPLPCPNLIHDISSADEKKRQAMRCFHSQLREQPYDTRTSGINSFRAFHLGAQVKSAEAFTLLAAADLDKGLATLLDGPLAYRRNLGFAASGGDIPLVSVIIRSMDRPTLTDALDSIALQTYSNIEVVLVNAKGSEHREIEPWCGRFPVRMIGTGERLARSRAANVGLGTARGDYLIFLDDDDWFLPDHIAGLVSVLSNTTVFLAAYSGVKCTDSQRNLLEENFGSPYNAVRLLAGNYIPIHAVLFSRELCIRGCHFDEQFDLYEDWDFWIQVASHTDFLFVDKYSACYRKSADGSGASNPANSELYGSLVLAKWRARWSDRQLFELIGLARESENYKKHAYQMEKANQLNEAYIGELRCHIKGLEEHIKGREEHIKGLEDHTKGLEDHIKGLVEEHIKGLEELTLQQAVADETLQKIYHSRSWRLTKPLRFVAQLLSGRLREKLLK